MHRRTITVVIPNYNHGHYLRDTVRRVEVQNRRPDEIIVVDDGSTDGSRELLKEIAATTPGFRAIFHDKNRGVDHALNTGLAVASSDYVFFGGADDYILPDFIEHTMAMAERYPQAGTVASDPMFDHAGELDVTRFLTDNVGRYLSPSEITARLRLRPRPIPVHASIFRRDVILEAGGFNEKFRWHSDWFVSLVASLKTGVAYVPRGMSAMRVANTTYSAQGIVDKEAQERVLKTLAAHILALPDPSLREAFKQSGMIITLHDVLRVARTCPDLNALISPRARFLMQYYAVRKRLMQQIPDSLLKNIRSVLRRARRRSSLKRSVSTSA